MRSVGGIAGLRIAHLIESDGPGGAERVVVQLATAFQAAGAQNVVFLPRDGEGWIARELEGSGVAIDYFRIERPVSVTCARALVRAFRRDGIDLAHSHEFSMAVYGAWASRRGGIPHVTTMHGGRYYAHRLRRRLALRAAMAVSARAIAVSASLARDLSRNLWFPQSRILTIPNGVRHTPPDRVTLRDELQLRPDDRLLVSIGNLYPVKGHIHLIDAVALVADRWPALHVAIAGRGELADALAARARAHGLAHRIHLLGLRSDVAAILGAADVFVLPSLSEGLPLALLEAMFAACPIVASDVGEVRVALADGDAGVLVAAGDPAALATSIDHLLRDPTRARNLGDRAARQARAEYDVSHMVRRYLEIYEGLTRGCSPTPPQTGGRRLGGPVCEWRHDFNVPGAAAGNPGFSRTAAAGAPGAGSTGGPDDYPCA